MRPEINFDPGPAPSAGLAPGWAEITTADGAGADADVQRGNPDMKGVGSWCEMRNSRFFMGGTLRPPEFSWKSTDETAVRRVVESLR